MIYFIKNQLHNSKNKRFFINKVPFFYFKSNTELFFWHNNWLLASNNNLEKTKKIEIMKTIQLIAAGIILFAASTSQAQVSINVNLGSPVVVAQPTWVPQNHSNVDFYYIPDIQSYYDVNNSVYVYRNNGNWCRTRYVPVQYLNYNLNHAHRVALRGYHGNQPYAYYNNHTVRYNNNRDYNSGRKQYNNRRYADNYKGNKRYDKHNRYDRDDRDDDDRRHHNGYRNRR